MGPSKHAFVTGSASGIGAALTTALANHGHRVTATDVNIDALRAAQSAAHWPTSLVNLAPLDVRSPSEWAAAIEHAEAAHGPLDALYNVAGVLRPSVVCDITDSDVHAMIDVNLKGTIFGTRAAAIPMVARGRGHIINVGSLASLAPVAGLNLYTASKFGVRGFTLACAEELAPRGVAVTLVMPDAVDTPMLTLQETYDEAALVFSGGHPLTAADVVTVLLNVMASRPVEVTIPSARGALARVASTFPEVASKLSPIFRALGRRAQSARLEKKG